MVLCIADIGSAFWSIAELTAAGATIPILNLRSWFKSKDITDGNTWSSAINGYVATRTHGTVNVQTASGNGATGNLKHMYGNTATGISFGNIATGTFTICSLARYTGGTQGRIFNGANNFLHGHWSGRGAASNF